MYRERNFLITIFLHLKLTAHRKLFVLKVRVHNAYSWKKVLHRKALLTIASMLLKVTFMQHCGWHRMKSFKQNCNIANDNYLPTITLATRGNFSAQCPNFSTRWPRSPRGSSRAGGRRGRGCWCRRTCRGSPDVWSAATYLVHQWLLHLQEWGGWFAAAGIARAWAWRSGAGVTLPRGG